MAIFTQALCFSLALVSTLVYAANPETELLTAPTSGTYSRSAAFAFTTDNGTAFRCKLDKQPYQPCTSPQVFHGLAAGNHTFRVQSYRDGAADPTPVIQRWSIRKAPAGNVDNLNAPIGTNIGQLGMGEWIWLINHFPRMQGWLTQCDCWTDPDSWNTGEQAQLELDENGWVRSFGDDPARRFTHVAATLYNGSSQFAPAGQWLVLYEGEGTLDYDYAPFVTVVSRSPGRDVLNIAPQPDALLRIRISNINPANHLRNIRLIAPGGLCGTNPFAYAANPSACPAGTFRSFEQVYANQHFHPLLLKELKPYRALRFMQFSGVMYDYLNADRLDEPQQRHAFADRSQLSDALWAGGWNDGPPPHELMFELTNLLSADAWVNLHFWADDDYVRQLALLALNSVAPGLNVYLEWANEVWNAAPPYGFYGRRIEQWAEARWPDARFPDGTPMSGFTKRMNYVGMRSDQVCAIWKEVWGSESHRVRCVMPAGPFGYPASEALGCPLYAPEKGGANCAERMYAVAAAPYFGGYVSDFRNAEGGHFEQLSAWTQQRDGGVGPLFRELTDGSLLGTLGAIGYARDVMRQNKEVANAFGLHLVAYEAGQHLTPYSGYGTSCNFWNNPPECAPYYPIQQLYIQANRNSRMGTLYDTYLNTWREEGGELLMHYSAITTPHPQYGSWGAKEYVGQSPGPAPKYRSLMRFKLNNPCWWAGCAR